MALKFQVVIDDIFTLEYPIDDTMLREDMYQASFGQYVIDCGWYEAYDGSFITYLIKDTDWENPILKIISRDIEDAKWSINVCKEYLLR